MASSAGDVRAGGAFIEISADNAKLIKDLTGSKKKIAGWATKVKGFLSRAFRPIQIGALGRIAAGVGVAALGRSFIQAADTAEKLQLRLGAVLRDVHAGNALFKDMAKFAGEIPFEYENVIEAATSLAGVMKGGADEVRAWMPLMADLAAVSGFTLKETQGQFIRMYAAGANSADLFRERGILAMLGFKQGVKISAADTRKQLINEWTKAGSKFKGLVDKLKNTWTGQISILKDKWFLFRQAIMSAGPFDFLKRKLMALNEKLAVYVANAKAVAEMAWNWARANKFVIKTLIVFASKMAAVVAALLAINIGAGVFALMLNPVTAVALALFGLANALGLIDVGWRDMGKSAKITMKGIAAAFPITTLSFKLFALEFSVTLWRLVHDVGYAMRLIQAFAKGGTQAVLDVVSPIGGLLSAGTIWRADPLGIDATSRSADDNLEILRAELARLRRQKSGLEKEDPKNLLERMWAEANKALPSLDALKIDIKKYLGGGEGVDGAMKKALGGVFGFFAGAVDPRTQFGLGATNFPKMQLEESKKQTRALDKIAKNTAAKKAPSTYSGGVNWASVMGAPGGY